VSRCTVIAGAASGSFHMVEAAQHRRGAVAAAPRHGVAVRGRSEPPSAPHDIALLAAVAIGGGA
jgi:hypothetical protein